MIAEVSDSICVDELMTTEHIRRIRPTQLRAKRRVGCHAPAHETVALVCDDHTIDVAGIAAL
jgi:hypothetical protein